MPFLRHRGNLASETESGHTTSVPAELGPSAESDARHHEVPSKAPAPAQSLNHSSSPPTRRRDNHHPHSRAESPPIQEQNQRHKRFSTLRFRNASDSQLSVRLKQQAENPPPVPTPRMCLPKLIPAVALVPPSPGPITANMQAFPQPPTSSPPPPPWRLSHYRRNHRVSTSQAGSAAQPPPQSLSIQLLTMAKPPKNARGSLPRMTRHCVRARSRPSRL